MDPESKKLLQDTYGIAQENNKMLHSMKRSMRIQRVMSIVYWLFIIGSAVGAYYFAEPYLKEIVGLYGSTSKMFQSLHP